MRPELSYEAVAARIGRMLAAIAVAGTLAAFFTSGWKAGTGFLLGSAISAVNFRWLRRLVETLGGTLQRHTLVMAFRFLLLAGLLYVIVRFTPISLPAVLAGVFVMTAAVIMEAVIEIVYAGK